MAPLTYLPLAWTRGILMLMFTITTIVANALCVQMFKKHRSAQNLVNRNSPTGVTVGLGYDDVLAPAIVLFIVLTMMNLVSSQILLALVQARYQPFSDALVKRFKIPDKNASTRLLPLQAYAMLIGTSLTAVPVGFITFAVFNRQMVITAKSNGGAVPLSTVQSLLDILGVRALYRDTSYISIVPKTALAALALSIPATIVTFVAWYLRPCPSPQVDGASGSLAKDDIVDSDVILVSSSNLHS